MLGRGWLISQLFKGNSQGRNLGKHKSNQKSSLLSGMVVLPSLFD